MIRTVVVAGLPGSGKTSVIESSCKNLKFTFIGNNAESSEKMSSVAEHVDHYPMKSPCARVRQFEYRVELNSNGDVNLIISEPPGNCMEISSPMLNPFYVFRKDSYEIGPLITVIDGNSLLKTGVSRKNTNSLRYRSMINESDVIVITFSEDEKITEMIRDINTDAEILHFPKDTERIGELIGGDSHYSRALLI